MYAGPVSPLVALQDAVKCATANADGDDLRSFARLCSNAYREERKHIIETEILAEYDLESYAEYQALKGSDQRLHEALTEKIRKAEEDWNLLFFGFDGADRPHIFVITEYGKIQYCDAEGFAAIGSGAWIAYAALSRLGFNRTLPRGEALYGMLAAKFSAESADGVGEETALLINSHTDRLGHTVPGLQPKDIAELKQEWKQLPRIPDGAADRLEGYIKTGESEDRRRVSNPLRGYIKRSGKRKKSPG